MPHCLGAVGNGRLVIRRHTTCGYEEEELLSCVATLLGGSGQEILRNAPPHYIGVVGRVGVQCTPKLLWGNGHSKSLNALPYRLSAVSSENLSTHRHIAGG